MESCVDSWRACNVECEFLRSNLTQIAGSKMLMIFIIFKVSFGINFTEILIYVYLFSRKFVSYIKYIFLSTLQSHAIIPYKVSPM